MAKILNNISIWKEFFRFWTDWYSRWVYFRIATTNSLHFWIHYTMDYMVLSQTLIYNKSIPSISYSYFHIQEKTSPFKLKFRRKIMQNFKMKKKKDLVFSVKSRPSVWGSPQALTLSKKTNILLYGALILKWGELWQANLTSPSAGSREKFLSDSGNFPQAKWPFVHLFLSVFTKERFSLWPAVSRYHVLLSMSLWYKI